MKNHKTLRVLALAAAVLVTLPALASAQGVLFVKNNKVGIGQSDPQFPLHIVEAAAGNTQMIRLDANGAPFLAYNNTALGVTWGVQPTGAGDFSITKFGTGGAELEILQNGTVFMGPGGMDQFRLDPNGDVTIQGSLTQSSSRALKENFASMDSREVLAQVAALDVLEWSYKGQDYRHVGPMAEDFYAAFGTGASEKGLAPGDLAGVTLAALQGLNEVVLEKDREIEQLTRELAELRALVEQLDR